MPPDQPSPSAQSGVLQSVQPDIGSAAKPPVQLVIEVVAVVLVLIGGVGVAFGMYYFQHHGIALLPTANHSSTTPSSHAAASSLTTSPPPVAPPAPVPAPASAAPPPAPLPPTLTLTNQDNGRTVTIPVGTIVTAQLAQQAGVTGYHWNGLALSYRTWQLASVKQFGSNFSLVHGTDGSIRESYQIAAAGDFTLGYSDIPNCQPGCSSQQSLQLWEVHIHVP